MKYKKENKRNVSTSALFLILLAGVCLMAGGCVPASGERSEQKRSRQLESELQSLRAQVQEAERRAEVSQQSAISHARGLSAWQTVALVLGLGACLALFAGIAIGSVPRELPAKEEEGDVQDADYEIVE